MAPIIAARTKPRPFLKWAGGNQCHFVRHANLRKRGKLTELLIMNYTRYQGAEGSLF